MNALRVIPMLLVTSLLGYGHAAAADLAGDYVRKQGCLPAQTTNSLLPAIGYTDVRLLGHQRGDAYFDARKGRAWYRVAIDA